MTLSSACYFVMKFLFFWLFESLNCIIKNSQSFTLGNIALITSVYIHILLNHYSLGNINRGIKDKSPRLQWVINQCIYFEILHDIILRFSRLLIIELKNIKVIIQH